MLCYNNYNIEKVNIDKLIRVVYINRCIYGDLYCVICQPDIIRFDYFFLRLPDSN